MKKTLFLTGFLMVGFGAVPVASLFAADYDKVLAGGPSHDFVVINYDGQHVPPDLEAMLRYNTTIRIPAGESVMEAAAGDAADLSKPGSGEWIVQESTQRDAVYVKPTRQGISTNLEIRTDHNNRYTFFIADHSLDKDSHPHLEYIINPTGQSEIDSLKAPAKYVLAEKLEAAIADRDRYKTELSELEGKWSARYTEQKVVARQETLTGLVCDYALGKTPQEFHVQNTCHDKDWTYIWAKDAPEHFAIADISTGTPAMIVPEYDPSSGMYTIHGLPAKIRLSVGNGKKTKTAEIDAKKEGA